jgi:hypothetical protein
MMQPVWFAGPTIPDFFDSCVLKEAAPFIAFGKVMVRPTCFGGSCEKEQSYKINFTRGGL